MSKNLQTSRGGYTQVKLTYGNGIWTRIVFPIENGEVFHCYVSLPEGQWCIITPRLNTRQVQALTEEFMPKAVHIKAPCHQMGPPKNGPTVDGAEIPNNHLECIKTM